MLIIIYAFVAVAIITRWLWLFRRADAFFHFWYFRCFSSSDIIIIFAIILMLMAFMIFADVTSYYITLWYATLLLMPHIIDIAIITLPLRLPRYFCRDAYAIADAVVDAAAIRLMFDIIAAYYYADAIRQMPLAAVIAARCHKMPYAYFATYGY